MVKNSAPKTSLLSRRWRCRPVHPAGLYPGRYSPTSWGAVWASFHRTAAAAPILPSSNLEPSIQIASPLTFYSTAIRSASSSTFNIRPGKFLDFALQILGHSCPPRLGTSSNFGNRHLTFKRGVCVGVQSYTIPLHAGRRPMAAAVDFSK